MGAGAQGRLSTSGVRVSFEGVRAIDGVDLALRRGEILGLIGPNGAGKTTLVNVVTGLQPPDSGSVHLGDVEITGWSPPRRARAGLGRTFQGARLFDRLSVYENIEVVALAGGLRRGAGRSKARELLALFGLEDVAASEARSLPHGTARRLGVARALALNPSFLLLDEPAAGLDEEESAELVPLLKQIRDSYELGIVVIEHDVPLIMACCERIHVLHHGETLAVGTPKEISTDAEVISAYLGDAGAGDAGG